MPDGDPRSPESVAVVMYGIDLNDSGHYEWSVVDTELTDNDGRYLFLDPFDGFYSLYIINDELSGFSGYFQYGSIDTVINLNDILLDNGQTIIGKIELLKDTTTKDIFLGVVGTPFIDRMAIDNLFIFPDMAIGKYKIDVKYMKRGSSEGISEGNLSFPIFPVLLDTTFLVKYESLPHDNDGQVDSVWIENDSVYVNFNGYNIQYTIEN